MTPTETTTASPNRTDTHRGEQSPRDARAPPEQGQRRRRPLAPDTRTLDPRAARAWTEPMTVRSLDGGQYAVESDGGTYEVDLPGRRCSCPDSTYRGERCKHLRRVALEITERRVPAPDHETVTCRRCGRRTFVSEGAAPLCAGCRFERGEPVRDRETGDLLVVMATTDERADERRLGDGTVADRPTNSRYPADDPLVECVYPYSGGADRPLEELQWYAFPVSRLAAERRHPRSAREDARHTRADSTRLN